MGVGGVLAGFAWADALAAIIVAGILLIVAYRIGREGAEELIDSAASPVLNANMPAPTIAAKASAQANPASTPPTPKMTASEDSASERLCQAFAYNIREVVGEG